MISPSYAVLDLGLLKNSAESDGDVQAHCSAGRIPPIILQRFGEDAKELYFTIGADRDKVVIKYKQTF